MINAGGNTTNNRDRSELSGDGTDSAGRHHRHRRDHHHHQQRQHDRPAKSRLQRLATVGTVNNTAASTGTTSTARTSLAAQFDVLRTQIDEMARDSTFNGVSLLNNQSVTVIMNQSATTRLVVAGNNDTSLGLGIVASTNSFQTNFDANTAFANIERALATLQNQASTYTANVAVIQDRTDFTKQTINTLQTGNNDLTLADANQEGASLLALQTRQSLSSTALSLATQADQNVLRLFQ